MLVGEMKQYLTNQMIPFWKQMKDEEFGGYYGKMDYNLILQKEAVKGCILNSRILWFFSNAYMELVDETLLEYANHAYQFLINYFWDKEYEGLYWSVNYDGTVADSTKHTYCQAFAIYALSSYYAISKDKDALLMAKKLFCIIEDKCTDKYGYLEAFDRTFSPEENDKLSENGVMADKTMNTLLHVFEAYTELCRVIQKEDIFASRIADKLRWMLVIIANKVYNPILKRQEVFFDKEYNSLIDLHSYGHDIEAAWLIDRGCEILGDATYLEKMNTITSTLTKQIYNIAFTGDSLYNESCKGNVDKARIWWVQAEGIVGFVNGYQKDRKETKYYDAAIAIWRFIQNNLIDSREGSEWFWDVDDNGVPNSKQGIVNMWKCPYHNGRMCLEIIRRLGHDS